MFEKEAEEWVKENMDCCKTDNSVNQSIPYFDEEERCCAKSAFQDGAEFGYNRANEWHDLRKDPNDLPKDNRSVWTNQGGAYHDSDGWFGDGHHIAGVIAWCEPQFKE